MAAGRLTKTFRSGMLVSVGRANPMPEAAALLSSRPGAAGAACRACWTVFFLRAGALPEIDGVNILTCRPG